MSPSFSAIAYTHAIMPTNLAIGDRLIEEARRVGDHSSKKKAVKAALDEYIRLTR